MRHTDGRWRLTRRGAILPRLGDEGDDGIWFLDTLEGRLSKNWDSLDELQSVLNTADGQDAFLMAGLAIAADESGKRPTISQILDFSIAPYLGGAFAVENDLVNSDQFSGQSVRKRRT